MSGPVVLASAILLLLIMIAAEAVFLVSFLSFGIAPLAVTIAVILYPIAWANRGKFFDADAERNESIIVVLFAIMMNLAALAGAVALGWSELMEVFRRAQGV